MYWLRLLLWGLIGSLIVIGGMTLAMSKSHPFTYNLCQPSMKNNSYPFVGTIMIKAISPISIKIKVSNIVNSTMLRVNVVKQSSNITLNPGDTYEVNLYPGDTLNITVFCGDLGIGSTPLPLIDVQRNYSRIITFIDIILLLLVLVGVFIVERKM